MQSIPYVPLADSFDLPAYQTLDMPHAPQSQMQIPSLLDAQNTQSQMQIPPLLNTETILQQHPLQLQQPRAPNPSTWPSCNCSCPSAGSCNGLGDLIVALVECGFCIGNGCVGCMHAVCEVCGDCSCDCCSGCDCDCSGCDCGGCDCGGCDCGGCGDCGGCAC
ncbi:hypothetical protein BJ741DRAFT_629063 [Chytriomyces cf. hyalinus JEL632]|nr:hypothetical protein BJ741DRAFT_629063 [Chytriomyces cf. hyalinus JEL632]